MASALAKQSISYSHCQANNSKCDCPTHVSANDGNNGPEAEDSSLNGISVLGQATYNVIESGSYSVGCTGGMQVNHSAKHCQESTVYTVYMVPDLMRSNQQQRSLQLMCAQPATCCTQLCALCLIVVDNHGVRQITTVCWSDVAAVTTCALTLMFCLLQRPAS